MYGTFAKHTSRGIMKDFYTRSKELLESNDLNTVMVLSKEFNTSVKTASTRIKTYYGKTVREIIREQRTPTKEECDFLLLTSTDLNDFKKKAGFTSTSVYFKGLFDKYYGVSNYQNAKARVVSKIPCKDYNPTIYDNKSIFLSQYFGDGSFDARRNSIRIEHGYKQKEYLLFKVGLFNKAFPTTKGIEGVREIVRKDTGYVSYTWYSGKLPNNYVEASKTVEEMTPLGIMLWYLDDGCYHISKSGQHMISLCIPDEEIKRQAYDVFKSYGIEFTVRDVELVLQDRVKITLFMNCFTKPFLHMIPECMRYKCEMKI